MASDWTVGCSAQREMQNNHQLLEQILLQQPSANASLPNVPVPGAPERTVSLKEIVDMANRIMKNKGWSAPYVVHYQDQNDAVLELNPKAWAEQKHQLSRDLHFMTFQDLAKVFQHTGRSQCSVKVNQVAVGRFFRSPLEGWVWETTGDEPPAPPSGKTIAQVITLVILVFLLLLMLVPIVQTAMRGPV